MQLLYAEIKTCFLFWQENCNKSQSDLYVLPSLPHTGVATSRWVSVHIPLQEQWSLGDPLVDASSRQIEP